MRKDMGKIITERERSGSSLGTEKFGKHIQWKGWDYDYDEPKTHSGSQGRTYGWEAKNFTDVLGPLKRWLDKQVGRPWDKIYSEITKILDTRKVTHKHVIDHIFGWVARHAYLCVDGVWRDSEYRWSWSVPEYYVNPRTGLLCRNKKESKADRAAKYKKQEEQRRKDAEVLEMDGKHLKKINEIWYWVEYREATQMEYLNYCRGSNNHVFFMPGPGAKWMKMVKRQVARKDLKRINDWVNNAS